ncbi:MAG: DNA cytosine methyltransferase [Candidatus Kariarchaeaceae archaeon]|jgi:DNA (cytosine-5)-methyltransferase 1
MNIVDLFCGGGGSSSGFHQAGFKTLAAIDQVQACIDTYNYNFGDVAFSADISQLRSETILARIGEHPTVVTASPPCEPFTLANEKRIVNPFERLFDDEVGRLMLHAIRLIGDLNPEYFIIENVRGILDGEGRDLLSEEIQRLGLGNPYFTIVNAEEFGVPSKRVRVLISNFKIRIPRIGIKTLYSAINDLPEPNNPNFFEDHITTSISEKFSRKIPNLLTGEGLVYFRGAKSEMRNYIRIKYDEPAPVIMGKSRFIHPTEDRILTPREHARLMTFPDNHLFIGSTEEIYDMIGEAVPPAITHSIANQILENL